MKTPQGIVGWTNAITRKVRLASVVSVLVVLPLVLVADLLPGSRANAPQDKDASATTGAVYTWVRSYGGRNDETAWTVQQTSDGGYVVGGYTWSFGAGNDEFWLLRLGADGAVRWQRTYGGAGSEIASMLIQCRDGGYLVVGHSRSGGAGGADMWLLKLRADGTIEWQNTYGGPADDEGVGVEQTTDGGFIVAGETKSFGAGDWDVWVLKLTGAGVVQWQKTYGGPKLETTSADPIQQTRDGGYIVAGRTKSFGTAENDIWVLKLDAEGIVQWQRAYGGWGQDESHSVRQTVDGGYAVAGFTNSVGAGDYDIWLLKLNAQGVVQWQKTVGGSGRDLAWCVHHTLDGGCVVAGATSSFGAGSTQYWVTGLEWTADGAALRDKYYEGYADCWLLKLDAAGTLQWQKMIGGARRDVGESVRPTTDGGYVVAGGTDSFGAGREDFLVVKLDNTGNIPGCPLVKDSHALPGTTSMPSVDTRAWVADSSCRVLTTRVGAPTTSASTNSQCFAEPTSTPTPTVTPTDIPRPYRVRLPVVWK